jgi:hypothetical protein
MEELIPVVSFIILVATITTFILSIGAYILYRIREKKNKKPGVYKPQINESEINIPVKPPEKEIPIESTQSRLEVQQYQKIPPREQQKAGNYTGQKEIIKQEDQPNTKLKTMKVLTAAQSKNTQQQKTSFNNKEGIIGKKFIKYTSEGYVPVDEAKIGENIKWR